MNVENVFFNDALLNRTVALFENSALYKLNEATKELFTTFFLSITSLRMTSLSRTYYNGYLYNSDEKRGIYYLKQLSRDTYISICRNFLTSLFNQIFDGLEYIIADQLFSDTELNIERNLEYIPNLKSIVVVRDPRDTYAWALKKNIEWIAHKSVDEFIIWYHNQYKNIEKNRNNDNCLIVKYEDLVLDYENTIKEIERYLGYKENQHINKLKYFNPNISANFVGIYKNLSSDDIAKINFGLRGYCNPKID